MLSFLIFRPALSVPAIFLEVIFSSFTVKEKLELPDTWGFVDDDKYNAVLYVEVIFEKSSLGVIAAEKRIAGENLEK